MVAHQSLTPAKARKAIDRAGIRLTDKQLAAVLTYVTGGTKSDAMIAGGYAPESAWMVFEGGNVKAAIGVIIDSFLQTDAAPAALRALYMIVSDDRTAPGIRVQAANSLLDRSGYDAKRHAREAEQGKDPTQMSSDELLAEIEKLQAQIEGRMHDVTPVSETVSVPLTEQELELYE